ncbi:MAG: glycosyl hydrolase, partial [Spirochaetota bacterium]
WEMDFYRLALKVSGAVQAARWTDLPGGLGYIHSFNGPHSLFADTIRSLRSLAAAHALGHVLMSEQDRKISLLSRLLSHAETTARFNVYFGEGRDTWDVSGRVAHESIFNVKSGAYRCPSSQQGYSPFSTWTRGLAWILLGYAEELEYLSQVPAKEFESLGLPYFQDKDEVLKRFLKTAVAVADFHIENTPVDGIPYWDTGAPNLHKLGAYLDRPADPFNRHEPVDSSAAAISAQGLLRLGLYLSTLEEGAGGRYLAAAARTAGTLFAEPYLSRSPEHEGLLLHAVYHYPNGWDSAPGEDGIPRGESCMWGDYHLLELALCLRRLARGSRPQRFFDII